MQLEYKVLLCGRVEKLHWEQFAINVIISNVNGGDMGRDGSTAELDRATGDDQTKWVGRVEKMADDRRPKRTTEQREHGGRRRGRPRLRWEDCVKKDVRKT